MNRFEVVSLLRTVQDDAKARREIVKQIRTLLDQSRTVFRFDEAKKHGCTDQLANFLVQYVNEQNAAAKCLCTQMQEEVDKFLTGMVDIMEKLICLIEDPTD